MLLERYIDVVWNEITKARKDTDGDDNKRVTIIEENLNRTEKNFWGSISEKEHNLFLQQIRDAMESYNPPRFAELKKKHDNLESRIYKIDENVKKEIVFHTCSSTSYI